MLGLQLDDARRMMEAERKLLGFPHGLWLTRSAKGGINLRLGKTGEVVPLNAVQVNVLCAYHEGRQTTEWSD